MKTLFKYLPILFIVLLAGCSKEKPSEPTQQPVPAAEPKIFKKEIQTLHKSEDLKQSEGDRIAEEKKKIDAATQ